MTMQLSFCSRLLLFNQSIEIFVSRMPLTSRFPSTSWQCFVSYFSFIRFQCYALKSGLVRHGFNKTETCAMLICPRRGPGETSRVEYPWLLLGFICFLTFIHFRHSSIKGKALLACLFIVCVTTICVLCC